MSSGRRTGRRASRLGSSLTPRARNVLRAFEDARDVAPAFLVSCGVLPELSEAVTEALHRIVHSLADERFARDQHEVALRSALRKVAGSDAAADGVERQVTALMTADTTAAYLFGLAVGLSIGELPGRVDI